MANLRAHGRVGEKTWILYAEKSLSDEVKAQLELEMREKLGVEKGTYMTGVASTED